MGRPKKTTKSTEPVQPEIQPEVVSEEKAESGETQPPVTEVADETQLGTVLAAFNESDQPAEEVVAEGGEIQPAEIPAASDTELIEFASALSMEVAAEEALRHTKAETHALTNLPLQEGEELYTITQAALDANPELVEEGLKVGDEIILGPPATDEELSALPLEEKLDIFKKTGVSLFDETPEEVIMAALNAREDYMELNDLLEQFVSNPEDVQANRYIKKLLSGMVASGEIDVQNQVHLLLGSAYYKSGDPVTRYQSLRTVPVYAKKRV